MQHLLNDLAAQHEMTQLEEVISKVRVCGPEVVTITVGSPCWLDARDPLHVPFRASNWLPSGCQPARPPGARIGNERLGRVGTSVDLSNIPTTRPSCSPGCGTCARTDAVGQAGTGVGLLMSATFIQKPAVASTIIRVAIALSS